MSAVDVPVRTAPPPSETWSSLLRRYSRLLLIESRRSAMPVLLPLAAILFWFDSLRTANGFVPTWTVRASTLPNHVFPDVGPFAAGIAAWTGSREKRRGVSDLLSTTAWPGWRRQVATWGSCLAWTMLAYAGCVAVLYGIAAGKATWGGPPLWPVVVAGLAIALCCTTGFVAGTWFPSRFTAPLAAIGVLIVGTRVFQAAVGETGGITQISVSNAVPDPDLGVFFPVPPDVPIAQSIFLAGALIALLGSLAFRGNALSLAPRRLAVIVTLVGVAAAGTGLGLVSTSKTQANGLVIPALHDAASDRPLAFTPVCTSAAIPVCVHPAFQYELAQTESSLEPVLTAVAGLTGAPTRAEQVSPESPVLPANGQGQQQASTVVITTPAGGGAPILDFSLVQQIFTSFTMGLNEQFKAQAGVSVVQSLIAPMTAADPAQQAVEAGLLQLMGLPLGDSLEQALNWNTTPGTTSLDSALPQPGTPAYAAAKKFAALPAATSHAWLADHLTALRAGQITLAELP